MLEELVKLPLFEQLVPFVLGHLLHFEDKLCGQQRVLLLVHLVGTLHVRQLLKRRLTVGARVVRFPAASIALVLGARAETVWLLIALFEQAQIDVQYLFYI